ncbi:MAG: hypothetical protein OXE44_12600 [Nitrospinae bacterium]|nr:hypothetical protein [Nitrospinota bacterium]
MGSHPVKGKRKDKPSSEAEKTAEDAIDFEIAAKRWRDLKEGRDALVTEEGRVVELDDFVK